jgi:hypothetical protein
VNRLLVGLVAAVLVAGCAVGSPALEPAESMPPPPVAPASWVSVVAFGGAGGGGSVATEVQLSGRATALHAACAGLGSLVVQLGDGPVAPAVVFPCGGHGEIADNRYEIKNVPIPPRMTIIASVIEGAGVFYNPSFYISIEQPQP